MSHPHSPYVPVTYGVLYRHCHVCYVGVLCCGGPDASKRDIILHCITGEIPKFYLNTELYRLSKLHVASSLRPISCYHLQVQSLMNYVFFCSKICMNFWYTKIFAGNFYFGVLDFDSCARSVEGPYANIWYRVLHHESLKLHPPLYQSHDCLPCWVCCLWWRYCSAIWN